MRWMLGLLLRGRRTARVYAAKANTASASTSRRGLDGRLELTHARHDIDFHAVLVRVASRDESTLSCEGGISNLTPHPTGDHEEDNGERDSRPEIAAHEKRSKFVPMHVTRHADGQNHADGGKDCRPVDGLGVGELGALKMLDDPTGELCCSRSASCISPDFRA
jgi:hypothetical protein